MGIWAVYHAVPSALSRLGGYHRDFAHQVPRKSGRLLARGRLSAREAADGEGDGQADAEPTLDEFSFSELIAEGRMALGSAASARHRRFLYFWTGSILVRQVYQTSRSVPLFS